MDGQWAESGHTPFLSGPCEKSVENFRIFKEFYYFLNTPFVYQTTKKIQKIGDMHKLSRIELGRCDIDGDKGSYFGDQLKNSTEIIKYDKENFYISK